MRGQVRVSLLLSAGFLFLSTFVTGQNLDKPILSLGDALIHPLEETNLPVELSGLQGKAIVQLKLKVQFPDVPLRFVRVESEESENSFSIHINLESNTQDPEPTAALLLEVDSVEPLSEGPLLELIFEATDQIFENQERVLKIIEASARTAEGEEIRDLNLEDGKITISIPLFSCFFYMH